MQELINRAKSLLIYMSEEEVAIYLREKNVEDSDAFLAIKAASLLWKYYHQKTSEGGKLMALKSKSYSRKERKNDSKKVRRAEDKKLTNQKNTTEGT